MKKILKLMNNAVAAFVVLVVFLLIIPLPTAILDFMFIMQLGLSLVILLMTMYVKEVLEFSVFPTLLLVTTMLRLGLNISSTRSILTNNGYAGEVVKVFGQFVIRGDVVVGLVIFLIIVLVQFLVITKGAERVAEVSARFTLDAMPGKQMAIDADLSSGLIDEQTARLRRSNIQREASFWRYSYRLDKRRKLRRRYQYIQCRNRRRWAYVSDPGAADIGFNGYDCNSFCFRIKYER